MYNISDFHVIHRSYTSKLEDAYVKYHVLNRAK